MKKLICILLIMQCVALFHNYSYGQTHNLNSVKINLVDFDIETISDVHCDEYDHTFTGFEKKIKSFSDKINLLRFQSLRKEFKPVKSHRSFDVRGWAAYTYGNTVEKYCFDKFGYFYKGGKFYFNKDLLVYISDIMYADHAKYLDTLRP
jgi:hypothetical protein